MCDTLVATGNVTADGITLFGKNSDREPNEAHYLCYIPAETHPDGSNVKCTYLEIPQVQKTYSVLLAKPFWIWGAEMGANECGVVIGNEAVFTKVPYEKSRGLIGMDLLRLALERADSAEKALTVITDLIARYGQGGNCSFQHTLYYHNSFILADPYNAWVLETAGRHWAARRIEGVYTISNGLTIGKTWDLASPDLVAHATKKGWCSGAGDFHFTRCYSDFLYTTFSRCKTRRDQTMELLTSRQGSITPSWIMQVLRDHGKNGETGWRPDKGLTGATVCMHAGFGPARGSQTTGSMVCHLHPDLPTHFVTATAAACTGIFKPLWLDIEIPEMGPMPAGTYDSSTLFWRHESLHRETLRDYDTRILLYQGDRDGLEHEFVSGALNRLGSGPSERGLFSTRCFADANAAELKWLERIKHKKLRKRNNIFYTLAWKHFNRKARMTDLS